MIIEQLLHLGFSNANIKYSLQAVAERRLQVYLDKTVRGEIIWRGLDESVIQYAAKDVVYLEEIREQQLKECKYTKCTTGAQLENLFVPVIAYLEWCGIMLDIPKWKSKMESDLKNLHSAEKALNEWTVKYCVEHNIAEPYINKYIQLDLFDDVPHTPQCAINWSSSKQVIPFVKLLGFSTKTEDKKTGVSKDSVVEKLLNTQKGINDEFLQLYFKYQEFTKLCSTYGQNYLDAVNPITNRIHTTFKQLGATSGRMSCGNGKSKDTDLAKFKHIPESRCGYVQLQNLPSDEITRSCFIPAPENLMTSCDYAALELKNDTIHKF